MAYKLYLYKNIGEISLEIHRKEWTGDAIEIKAMGATPIKLIGLDNGGSDILTPIIKSSVNIDIKDLGEVNYKEFFTSDATKFKVVIKDKNVQVWGGYLTPDSYSQAYEYRTSINLIARDNLGMLDQLDFDWFENGFITSAQLIVKAQEKISWAMSPIMWFAQELKSEDGTNAIDAHINTELFRENTWWEALEVVLSSLGQQMRYVGSNKVFICNVADLHRLGNFGLSGGVDYAIGSAAQMEIVPSWRELDVEQDYGTIKELLNYNQDTAEWTFVKSATGGARHSLFKNSYFKDEGSGLLFYDNSTYRNSDNKNTPYYNTFLTNFRDGDGCVYKSFKVAQYKNGFQVKVSAWNYPAQVNTIQSQGNAREIKPFRYRGGNEWEPAEITLRLSAQFVKTVGGGVLFMDENGWTSGEKIIEFKLGQYKPEQQGGVLNWNDELKTFTINIPSMPSEDGELRICIHKPSVSGNKLSETLAGYADTVIMQDLTLSTTPNDVSGTTYKGLLNEQGNVKEQIDISVGEVPVNSGDYLTYAGGLFDGSDYHKALTGWHRTDSKGGVLPLSELVGRGYAHHYTAFRSDSGERTGGEIITAAIPFASTQDFAKRFIIRDKEFVLISGTYDVVQRRADATLRQVLPYEHAEGEFTVVNAVSGGGKTVIGGGDKSVVVWTNAAAGGADIQSKRTYELGELTEAQLDGAVLLADTPNSSTAKKVKTTVFAKTGHNHDKDYHPLGGQGDLGLIAENIHATQNITAARNITFGEYLQSPDFLSGLLGHGLRADAAGNIEAGSLKLRQFLETPELIKNRVRVAGAQTWFTENGITNTVTPNPIFHFGLTDHNGNLITTQYDNCFFVTFQNADNEAAFMVDDILRGIYHYETGFYTAFLRVKAVMAGGFLLESINGHAPSENMVLARQGNYTNVDRQAAVYVDAAEGYIRVLEGMNSLDITKNNLVFQAGDLSGLGEMGISGMPKIGVFTRAGVFKGLGASDVGADAAGTSSALQKALGGLAWRNGLSASEVGADAAGAGQSAANSLQALLKGLAYKDSLTASEVGADAAGTAQGVVNSFATALEESLGGLAYKDIVELAQLGSTVIQGGHIKTELIDALAIAANTAFIGRLLAQEAFIANLSAINATFNNITVAGNSTFGGFRAFQSSNQSGMLWDRNNEWLGFGEATTPEAGMTDALVYADTRRSERVAMAVYGKTDMPGVLAAGSVNSVTGSLRHYWSARFCHSSRYQLQTGKFTIIHNIGHTEYYVTANIVSSGFMGGVIILEKHASSCVVGVHGLDAGYYNVDFDFQICGRNYK